MKKVTFCFQVWYSDKRSIFECFKRFRKVYPEEELLVLIAGLKENQIEDYDRSFADIISKFFSISKIDYLTIEECPEMLGNGGGLRHPNPNKSYRDTWHDFNLKWLDRITDMVSDNTDILFLCSDDCMIMEPIPINYEIDVCGLITDASDWMEMEKIHRVFSPKLDIKNFLWFPATDFYFDFKKFKKAYNDETKNLIDDFIHKTYEPDLGMFTDFWCGLLFMYIFDTFEHQNYTIAYDTENHIVKKYGGKLLGDIQTVDEYPEDIYKRSRYVSIHSYKTFRNTDITDEIKMLGIE